MTAAVRRRVHDRSPAERSRLDADARRKRLARAMEREKKAPIRKSRWPGIVLAGSTLSGLAAVALFSFTSGLFLAINGTRSGAHAEGDLTAIDHDLAPSNTVIEGKLDRTIESLGHLQELLTHGLKAQTQRTGPRLAAATAVMPPQLAPRKSPPEAAMPDAPLEVRRLWASPSGDTVYDTLRRWTDEVGIGLAWAADVDYPLEQAIAVNGTFSDAADALLMGFAHLSPRPKAVLHANARTGRPVMVVRAEGNDAGESGLK